MAARVSSPESRLTVGQDGCRGMRRVVDGPCRQSRQWDRIFSRTILGFALDERVFLRVRPAQPHFVAGKIGTKRNKTNQ